MGIPAFFRYVLDKYPKAIVDCREELPHVRFSFFFPAFAGHCRPLSCCHLTVFQVDVQAVTDGEARGSPPVIIPDVTQPNPNGVEFDCLYLDLNGLIHPAFHPEGAQQPETEAEAICQIFLYIDRLFNVCRPRKLLYIAGDGVAPRAKMNQQRSRRYCAAQERQAKQLGAVQTFAAETGAEDFSSALSADTRADLAAALNAEVADSNVITPGTPFMSRLSAALRAYVAFRVSSTPAWQAPGFRVILSDASVPGEGEHKIMAYIRQQRSQPGYDPSMHHAIYGLDADLIMLALATHEANFSLLREVVFDRGLPTCSSCGQVGHRPEQCDTALYFPEMASPASLGRFVEELFATAGSRAKAAEVAQRVFGTSCVVDAKTGASLEFHQRYPVPIAYRIAFQWLHVNTLREYLRYEFQDLDPALPEEQRTVAASKPLPFAFSLERCIDDWIFLCFLVGNDFLPHLPSVEIREGGVDTLVRLYKLHLPSFSGYITEAGEIHWGRLYPIVASVAKSEALFFRAKAKKEELRERGAKNRARRNQEGMKKMFRKGQTSLVPATGPDATPGSDIYSQAGPAALKGADEAPSVPDPFEHLSEQRRPGCVSAARYNLPHSGPDLDAAAPDGFIDHEWEPVHDAERRDRDPCALTAVYHTKDVVRLHVPGYQKRYRAAKFGIGARLPQGRKLIVPNTDSDPVTIERVGLEYLKGLRWVLQYYMLGVQDWAWYYPFHSAPLASDLAAATKLAAAAAGQERRNAKKVDKDAGTEDEDEESISIDNPLLADDDKDAAAVAIRAAHDDPLGLPPGFTFHWDVAARPFTPFEQLLSVLPPASAGVCLPPPLARLMLERAAPEDPGYGLRAFYPSVLHRDLDGAVSKPEWLSTNILPFIDADLLSATAAATIQAAQDAALAAIEDAKTSGDAQALAQAIAAARTFRTECLRATRGKEYIFAHASHATVDGSIGAAIATASTLQPTQLSPPRLVPAGAVMAVPTAPKVGAAFTRTTTSRSGALVPPICPRAELRTGRRGRALLRRSPPLMPWPEFFKAGAQTNTALCAHWLPPSIPTGWRYSPSVLPGAVIKTGLMQRKPSAPAQIDPNDRISFDDFLEGELAMRKARRLNIKDQCRLLGVPVPSWVNRQHSSDADIKHSRRLDVDVDDSHAGQRRHAPGAHGFRPQQAQGPPGARGPAAVNHAPYVPVQQQYGQQPYQAPAFGAPSPFGGPSPFLGPHGGYVPGTAPGTTPGYPPGVPRMPLRQPPRRR
jgi:5'-3' exonuclease